MSALLRAIGLAVAVVVGGWVVLGVLDLVFLAVARTIPCGR
jgi:hypothetical protein